MVMLTRVVVVALVVSMSVWAAANQGLLLRLNPAAIELWRVTEGEHLRGRCALDLQLSPECTQEFWKFTGSHVGELLELRVAETLTLTAVIQAPINTGGIRLAAVATEAEALTQMEELEQAIAGARGSGRASFGAPYV